MTRKYNRGPSEAQSDALYRRDHSFTEASGQSFTVAWDYHNREPRDLREATFMVRKAYSDEVPTRLHEGYDSIGEGGTPKMDVRAEGYLFGHDEAGYDPEHPAMDYYRTPFRAALRKLGKSPRGRIVRRVAIEGAEPVAVVMGEGVPHLWAELVAYHELRKFLANLTDVKINLAKRTDAA